MYPYFTQISFYKHIYAFFPHLLLIKLKHKKKTDYYNKKLIYNKSVRQRGKIKNNGQCPCVRDKIHFCFRLLLMRSGLGSVLLKAPDSYKFCTKSRRGGGLPPSSGICQKYEGFVRFFLHISEEGGGLSKNVQNWPG